MRASRHARKYRASFGFGFAANRDHILKNLPSFPDLEDLLSLFTRQIDVHLSHRPCDQRIDVAGLESRALRLEQFATYPIQPRFSHLAASAVVHANKKYLFFRHDMTVAERPLDTKLRFSVE